MRRTKAVWQLLPIARLLRSFVLVASAISILQICTAAPALAASQLTSIHVSSSANGTTQLVLVFTGGLPAGYHIVGAGTTDVTLILPETTPGSNVNQTSYPGANALQNFSISTAGSELDIALNLTAPAQIFTAVVSSTLVLTIGPARGPRPFVTPAPLRKAAPNSFPRTNGRGRVFEVVPLKYADVSEVVGILVQGQEIPPNDVFQPTGSIFSLPTSGSGIVTTQSNQLYNQTETKSQSLGDRINDNIAIDRRLNAVILTGTPAQVAALKAKIEKIDVPLPSVMLECEVVELSTTAARDLGIDYTNGPGTGLLTVGSTNNTGSAASPLGAVNSVKLQAQVFAAIAHGEGKLLATPRVLAADGTPAQILTGDALPIISTTIYPGSPTISQETVNYIAVGVDLQIQPRITGDGYVTSDIFAEVSSVTAYVSTLQGPVPQVSLRQASTVATVRDGSPFIIGGLLKDEEVTNISKIPFLGDIPIIGNLFKIEHSTLQRTNLYIIITPHIIATVGHNPPPHGIMRPEVPGPLPTFAPPPILSPSPQPSP